MGRCEICSRTDNASGTSSGTRAENENIAFDLAYVDYISPSVSSKLVISRFSLWTFSADRSSGPPAARFSIWKMSDRPLFTLVMLKSGQVMSAVSAMPAISMQRETTEMRTLTDLAVFITSRTAKPELFLSSTVTQPAEAEACDSYCQTFTW